MTKARGWNTCSGACSYIHATYWLARLGNNGLILSKTWRVYFKTITLCSNSWYTLKQFISRENQLFICSSVIWNVCRIWETSRPGSEIERTSKMSYTEWLVHDLSLGHHGSSIESWLGTVSVLEISQTSCNPHFFNRWLRACRLCRWGSLPRNGRVWFNNWYFLYWICVCIW